MRYKVVYELYPDADGPEEAAREVLSWFGDGMTPIADVTPIDEEGNEIGETEVVETACL